eukprot:5442836-Prymnesium_polylepis.1
MSTGQRADWVVRCPPGTHPFVSEPTNQTTGWMWQQQLASVVATDQNEAPCELPTFVINRPCYLADLTAATPDL